MIVVIFAWGVVAAFLGFCAWIIGLNIRDSIRAKARRKEHDQFWTTVFAIRKIPDNYDRQFLEWHYRLAHGNEDPGSKPVPQIMRGTKWQD